MGFWDLFVGPDINQGVKEWKNTPDAVLLDVRSKEEYRGGHIPGSLNIPLDELSLIQNKVPKRETPLFVHCLSGARSGQAVEMLKKMGYTNVKNIGGISRYKGKVEG